MSDQNRSEYRFSTISFLSDFGYKDELVGIVHSVIRDLAPDVRVVDVSHGIEPHDVRAGGLALARATQYMAPGVVLGAVDPGVGGERKPVAIEVANGAAFLVGPDNGLLAPAVAMVGGATAAVVLDNAEYHLPSPGLGFAGRDVFAPVAAHLCRGVELSELGSPIDPIQLLPGLLSVSEQQEDGSIRAEVLWVDRYGNAQLNVDPDQLGEEWPDVVSITGGRVNRNAARVDTFSDIPTGGFGLLVDSYGLLAIAVDRSSAAEELSLAEGDEIVLVPSDAAPSLESPVTLSSKPSSERPVEGTEAPN